MIRHPRYEAGEPVGEGGQGRVVRVRDREAPDLALVAKVVRSRAGAGALRAEFAALCRLRLPGLATPHDLATDEGTGDCFLVEELVAGPDARAYVEQGASASERRARFADVLSAVADTLAAMHDAGVLHGDLKPEHVRVDRSGRPVLLDLGAAVTRGDDAVALTRAYAAPEILAGARPSVASDLHGLGAVAWAMVTGRPPPPARERRPLREVTSELAPSVCDAVDRLLADHPRDRPEDARWLLGKLGARTAPRRGALASEARASLASALIEPVGPSVRYVTGPSGTGKSWVLSRAETAARLDGRGVRRITLPDPRAARLVAFLRGASGDLPFAFTPAERRERPLVLLDEADVAPADLLLALDAYACRHGDAGPAIFVVASRARRAARDALALGALDAAEFDALCSDLRIPEGAPRDALARASGRIPGWIALHVAGAPLTEEAILDRARSLSEPARAALAGVAACGGVVGSGLAESLGAAGAALDELLAAGLVTRRAAALSVGPAEVAARLAAALATHDDVDRAASAALGDPRTAPEILLALAAADAAPSSIRELYREAAARAREAGHRDAEIRALSWLGANREGRTSAGLARLERLVRDAGTARAHPEVLGWLGEAAEVDPALRPLADRRKADSLAREGRFDEARALVRGAREASRARGDVLGAAFAEAQLGALALYQSDWPAAEVSLSRARETLAGATSAEVDPEELARLDHNAGVVALYRGLWDDARAMLERSLEQKRALGDLAGTRACLLNLGIAHTKARAWSSADAALGEACRLAETLGQRAGLGWCIAARAELALRRGDAAAALLSAREADALRDALPPPVIADIALIRAEAFAELGDGEAAHRALGEVGAELRASDRALSARAELARAKTLLASAPADPRAAARAAVRAAREARAAGLADLEALARETLTRARPPRARSPEPMHTPPSSVEPLVASVLARIASGEPAQRSMEALLAAIVTAAGAERAFLVRLDARAAVAGAVAVDLDGLPLASAAERVPLEITSRAAASDGLVFHRDVEASARRGSRLALRAGSSTVLVLEHRFAPGAFDALTRERVEPWALLGAVLARIDDDARLREDPAGAIVAPARAAPASPSASSAASAAPWSTELPTATAGRTYREIVGDGAAMRKAKARLDAAVDSDLPVLLLGETGTGKEVFARALHAHGPRARGPLVAINCAAIPDSLFEAELFGHARGAFTGAERARPGLLSRADGGTLFLDEVGELSPSRQATLLRALETRRFRPVGIDEERPFDVRVCAATNRDLASDPAFRRDLYFRLGVLTITLPPLRERTEDIPLLLERFFEERGARVELSPRALSALSAYAWPGNVRELLHEALRLTTLRVSRADASHLSRAIRAADQARPPRADKERAEVERALARTGGNITHAAELLGLTRHGLKKRMLRLGLRGKEERRA